MERLLLGWAVAKAPIVRGREGGAMVVLLVGVVCACKLQARTHASVPVFPKLRLALALAPCCRSRRERRCGGGCGGVTSPGEGRALRTAPGRGRVRGGAGVLWRASAFAIARLWRLRCFFRAALDRAGWAALGCGCTGWAALDRPGRADIIFEKASIKAPTQVRALRGRLVVCDSLVKISV